MKKLLSFILAFVLLVSFSACGVEIEEQNGHASDNYDLEEALAYLASIDVESATVEDKGLWAPAKNEEGSYGYINVLGAWVREPEFFETKNTTNQYGICLNNYSQYAYIDKDGNERLSMIDGCRIAESNHFSDGMLVAALNLSFDQKYLYLDENFNVVITADGLPKVPWRNYNNTKYFAVATAFSGDRAVVMRQKNAQIADGLGAETAYIINKAGEIVGNLPEGLDPYSSSFDNNGNIIVCNSENRFGLCSNTGSLIMECKFRSLKHCGGSLYLACDDNGFWGYVDASGNTKISFQYQKGMPFSEGLAAVFDGNHWGFIHEDGSVAIEFIFDDVAAMNYPNEDSSLNQAAFKDGLAAVKAYGYWALIDCKENPVAILSEADCQGIDNCPYSSIRNGFVTFSKNVNGSVLYGVLNEECKMVIRPQFGYIGSFN